jgi:hypothetical protein
VLVAIDRFSEASPNQTPLSDFQGRTLFLPKDRSLRPSAIHLGWHRKKHKFQES